MASPIDFIAGCVGGIILLIISILNTNANDLKGAAGVLVGHPLDTIKVVMQTSAKRLTMTSVLADHSVS